MSSPHRIRILIADDHPLYRHGVHQILGGQPDLAVIGEATNGESAVAQAAALQPDVILMDIKMPGTDGIAATRSVLAVAPATRVLMVTMFEDDATVFAAMRAGARGYVLKDAEKDEILRAVRAVAGGEAIFSAAVAGRMLDFFAGGAGGAAEVGASLAPFEELTAREREILQLMARGLDNGEIADRLVLSLKTVRNYVSNILGKLQVADRARAIIKARDAGLR